MEHYSTPKAMKQIGGLFERYKARIKAPQATVEKEFVQVVKDVAGFDIKFEQVVYTPNARTITLRVSSIMKSELKFKQQAIFQELENRLGKDGCPKVIF